MSTKSINNLDVHQLEQVVCVMTHLRAGSGLMSSLLDGHSNLIGTPDDILLGYYEFWDKYGHLPANQIVSSFLEYYAVLFDAWGTCMCPRAHPQVGDLLNWTTLGADRNEALHVDQEGFKRVMTDLVGTEDKINRKLFFQALHVAYAEALGRQVEDPQIVFGMHIAHAAPLRKFYEDFPDGKFLQMVRHPISNLGSHFMHYRESGHLSPTTASSAIGVVVGRPDVPLQRRSQWRGVRLEEIHQNPRETMQRVCDWLQIPWDDALLKSTVNGKQWWNEKSEPQVTGPSDVIISQSFEEYIPAFDRFRLNVLSAKRCLADGYEVKAIYQWTATRLLVLPLLVIPFKIERMCLFSVRQGPPSSDDSTIKPKSKSVISSISGAIHGYYRGRRVMVGAWLRLFTKEHNDLEMI